MIVRHFDRLRVVGDHPFSEFEAGIKALIDRLPEDYEATGAWDEMPFWSAIAAHCRQDKVGTDVSRVIYEWMAEEGWHPKVVSTALGDIEFGDCYVTQSPALAEAALEAQVPTISLSPVAAAVWLKKGARDLEAVIHLDISWKEDKPVPLVEVVPEFGEVLSDAAMERSYVRFVGGLALCVADSPVSKPCVLEAGELWMDREQLDDLSWQQQMELLIGEVVNAGWFSGDAASAFSQLLEHSVLQLRKSVAEGADLAERLLLAVRGVPHRLLESFDEATRSAIPDNVSDDGRRLAELALLIHGPAVLARMSETLDESGLRPPTRWGTQEARNFVAALGFPPEFAVSPRAKRKRPSNPPFTAKFACR